MRLRGLGLDAARRRRRRAFFAGEDHCIFERRGDIPRRPAIF
jgi:hypothetical protein